jgi:cell division septation protein DedD
MVETGEAGTSREQAPVARSGQVKTTSAGPVRSSEEERYLLLAATYGNIKQAEALQQRLRTKKFPALIIKQKTGGKTLYQVRVGPLTGAKAAEDAANRLKSQEKISPKVVKLAPRTSSAKPTRKPST